jgi:hypothetical protein
LVSLSFNVKEDGVVSGHLIDIDNAGNRSEPRLFSLVAKDTIAPPQPGELGIIAISEVEDPLTE